MKKIQRNRFTFLLYSCLLLAGCRHDNSESRTLNELSDLDGSEFRALYFYPSTVRMLSRVFGDSTGTTLKEIKSGRVFFTLSEDDETIKGRFKTLQSEIENEDYENLMKIKSPGSLVSAYMKDTEIPNYVVFTQSDAGYLILEVSGKLSPESLREISTLDLSKAAEMFDILPTKEKAANDSIQKPTPKTGQQ